MDLLSEMVANEPELMDAIQVPVRRWNSRDKTWHDGTSPIVLNLIAAIARMNSWREDIQTSTWKTGQEPKTETERIHIMRTRANQYLSQEGLSLKHSEALIMELRNQEPEKHP